MTLEYEAIADARPLQRIPDGKYVLNVSRMKYAGIDAVLVLRLRKKISAAEKANFRAKSLGKRGMPLKDGGSLYFELPLTSDGESNLVVLDIDRIKGRFWKPMPSVDGSDDDKTLDKQANSDSEASSDLESDSEEHTGVKGGKRQLDGRSNGSWAKRPKLGET